MQSDSGPGVLMAEKSRYSVRPLSEVRLSWLVRFQLRRIRKRHGTGLLMHALIRTPVRSVSANKPVASVSEGGVSLCGSSSASKFPKWVPLAPGRHDLSFYASRSRSRSSFDKRFTLREGDVLVAVCEPIQQRQRIGYRHPPSADRWYLNIIGTDDSVSPTSKKR